MGNSRIAWVYPMSGLAFYLQPVLREFTQLFPNTVLFTGEWPGYVPGCENTFEVEIVGKTRDLKWKWQRSDTGYKRGFHLLSPALIPKLLKFNPVVLFVSGLNLWTLLIILLKRLKKWQIILVYSGSSPNVDMDDARLRQFVRQRMAHYIYGAIPSDSRPSSPFEPTPSGHPHRAITTRFMNTPIRIAVLLTCHNRRDKTIHCLKALHSQNLPDQVQLSVYLVDDGSTDGTSEAVRQSFPQVKILQGSGQLFWTGGMQLAFAESSKENPDFYFWLNDDTNLYLCAIQSLLHTYRELEARGEKKTIVVGSTQDPDTGVATYGGLTRSTWLHPLRFSLSHPSSVPKQCATMTGNAVLIPQDVFALTGNLDTTFKHYIADYDYGLRARQRGCSIWIAPSYSGTCQWNIPESRRGDWNLPAQQQFKKLQEPKGLQAGDTILYSFEEWKLFSRRHGGFFWFIYWLLPYRRLIKLRF